MFSGNTILGERLVIMIVDPNGIASAFGTVAEDVEDQGRARRANRSGRGEPRS